MAQENKSKLLMITSMIIWGSIGVFRRYIPISSALLSCLRGLIGAAFLMVILLLRKNKSQKIEFKKICLLAFVGCLIGINWMLLFEAYNYTSIAVATLCYYMQPTILILASPILFKERITQTKIVCAIVSLAGMVLVSGAFDTQAISQLKGPIYGLLAALLYSTVIVLNKKLTDIDVYLKTMIQLLFAGLSMIPYLVLTKTSISIGSETLTILMIGIVGLVHTGVAYVLYFGSIENIDSQSIGLLSYIDPISALFLSTILLNEKMSILGAIGAFLILGSLIFSEVRRK